MSLQLLLVLLSMWEWRMQAYTLCSWSGSLQRCLILHLHQLQQWHLSQEADWCWVLSVPAGGAEASSEGGYQGISQHYCWRGTIVCGAVCHHRSQQCWLEHSSTLCGTGDSTSNCCAHSRRSDGNNCFEKENSVWKVMLITLKKLFIIIITIYYHS